MRTVFVGAVALLAVMCSQAGHVQFRERLGNPTVAVPVEHPPALGQLVEFLVLGPARGPCAEEIVRILHRNLRSNDLDITNEARLYDRIARYDFDYNGRVDQRAAVEMGNRLGPSTMLALDVRRCETETNFSTEDESRTVTNDVGEQEQVSETTYRLEARAMLDLTVQMIDLTTGAGLAMERLAYASDEQEYSSKTDYPEEPFPLDLLHEEMGQAVEEVRRMVRPWTEEIKVVYFDDRACGLRDSYRPLRRGDIDEAYMLSLRSLASCKGTPNVEDKLLARAYYNVGILRVFKGDYDGAIEVLQTAAGLRRSGIVNEAIATARKAQELAASMERFERQTLPGVPRRGYDMDRHRDAGMDRDRSASRGNTMRNADVIEMVGQGIPTSIILTKMRESNHDFDTSTQAIVSLVNAGVDKEIIEAMLTAN